jgi:hypothetical protein
LTVASELLQMFYGLSIKSIILDHFGQLSTVLPSFNSGDNDAPSSADGMDEVLSDVKDFVFCESV